MADWAIRKGILPGDFADEQVKEHWLETEGPPSFAQGAARNAARYLVHGLPIYRATGGATVEAGADAKGRPVVNVNVKGGRVPADLPADRPVRDPLRTRLPSQVKVRVYKRVAGRRTYIDDYTVDDLGTGPIAKFLKQEIDPDAGDPSGLTNYEVHRVDADDQDLQPAIPITIEGAPRAPPPDEISRLRELLGVVKDMQGDDQEKSSKLSLIVESLKKRMSEGGSMSDLVALTMLERLQQGTVGGHGGGGIDGMLKMLDYVRAQARPASPPMLPDIQLAPPPNDMVPLVSRLIDKVTDRPEPKPPPPPPTTLEIVRDMAAMKDLFKDPTTDLLRAELGSLRLAIEKIAAGPAKSGLDSFTETVTAIRSIAPMITGIGGLGGALAGIFTPELQRALGGLLGEAAGRWRAASGAPAAPALPQPSVPEAAKKHEEALKVEKSENAQIAHVLYILQAYHADPAWAPKLQPYLQALIRNDLPPVRELVRQVLTGLRPDLINDLFIERVVKELVATARGDRSAPTAPAVITTPTPPAPESQPAEPLPVPSAAS